MKLAELMEKRGISGRQLAKKSGVSYVMIMSYLRSDQRQGKYPSLKSLIALARALNCTLEELTGLESLRSMEKKTEAVKSGEYNLSPKAKEFARLYNNITDKSKKELIEAMIVKAAESKAKDESQNKEESEKRDEK